MSDQGLEVESLAKQYSGYGLFEGGDSERVNWTNDLGMIVCDWMCGVCSDASVTEHRSVEDYESEQRPEDGDDECRRLVLRSDLIIHLLLLSLK